MMIDRILSIALAFGLVVATTAVAGGEGCPSSAAGGEQPGVVAGECGGDCSGDCGEGACGKCTGACDKGEAVVEAKPVPLSRRVAELVANAEQGCEASGERLDVLTKACGTDCGTSLMKEIMSLEQAAGDGCRKSKWQLAVMEARFDGKPAPKAPMSVRVAMLRQKADRGCETSMAVLTAVGAECESGCDTTLVRAVEKLEDAAAKGCEKSQARLAALAKLMPAPAKAAGEGCCGKEGCDSSGACPGACEGGECAPKGEAPAGACPESGCPSGKKATA